MRVQRTRSSASPPHSPLTRHPLGGFKRQRLSGNEVLSWPAVHVGGQIWCSVTTHCRKWSKLVEAGSPS